MIRRKRPGPYGWTWSDARRIALRRDKYQCFYCGISKRLAGRGNMHVHHIIPYKLSKSNVADNLVTLCRKCHVQVECGKIDLHGTSYTQIKRWKDLSRRIADIIH